MAAFAPHAKQSRPRLAGLGRARLGWVGRVRDRGGAELEEEEEGAGGRKRAEGEKESASIGWLSEGRDTASARVGEKAVDCEERR